MTTMTKMDLVNIMTAYLHSRFPLEASLLISSVFMSAKDEHELETIWRDLETERPSHCEPLPTWLLGIIKAWKFGTEPVLYDFKTVSDDDFAKILSSGILGWARGRKEIAGLASIVLTATKSRTKMRENIASLESRENVQRAFGPIPTWIREAMCEMCTED